MPVMLLECHGSVLRNWTLHDYWLSSTPLKGDRTVYSVCRHWKQDCASTVALELITYWRPHSCTTILGAGKHCELSRTALHCTALHCTTGALSSEHYNFNRGTPSPTANRMLGTREKNAFDCVLAD